MYVTWRFGWYCVLCRECRRSQINRIGWPYFADCWLFETHTAHTAHRSYTSYGTDSRTQIIRSQIPTLCTQLIQLMHPASCCAGPACVHSISRFRSKSENDRKALSLRGTWKSQPPEPCQRQSRGVEGALPFPRIGGKTSAPRSLFPSFDERASE